MPDAAENSFGRFDVHSHLLPGIDDGCATLADSIACGRELVRAGYTHSFCTPHFWPSLRHNTVTAIKERVANLHREFVQSSVPLKLYPGGEMNLRPDLMDSPFEDLPTFNMAGKYALFDLWADKIPSWFEPNVRWMQGHGLTLILAHPERMRAVQLDPNLADYFAELGLLLQGNLQCFGDQPRAATRQVAERYLMEDRYFLLGMDLHNLGSMPVRFAGLNRVIELVGNEKIDQLTIKNPQTLID